MNSWEDRLSSRQVARAFDFKRLPFTPSRLKTQCASDIKLGGRNAQTYVYMKGSRGARVKNRRGLISGGPLGNVLGEFQGFLEVGFPSLKLLNFLNDGRFLDTCLALASYYFDRAEPKYPAHIPLELAFKIAQEITEEVDIADDVIEALYLREAQTFSSVLAGGLVNVHSICTGLLLIESEACLRRWKKVDLARWDEAKIGYPVR